MARIEIIAPSSIGPLGVECIQPISIKLLPIQVPVYELHPGLGHGQRFDQFASTIIRGSLIVLLGNEHYPTWEPTLNG